MRVGINAKTILQIMPDLLPKWTNPLILRDDSYPATPHSIIYGTCTKFAKNGHDRLSRRTRLRQIIDRQTNSNKVSSYVWVWQFHTLLKLLDLI